MERKMWMNTYDIDDARAQFRDDPVMGPATKTLAAFRDIVNCNSDGWPYWKAARQTDAYRLCQALRARLVSMLPGYDEAETWSIGDVKEAMSE